MMSVCLRQREYDSGQIRASTCYQRNINRTVGVLERSGMLWKMIVNNMLTDIEIVK